MILLLLLPASDVGVHDTYDAVIWNVYKTREGRECTQLLVLTYTRKGMRIEDWRAPDQPPIVQKRGRGFRVWFVDDRNRMIRCIHCRTYSVLRSAMDYEMANRREFPREQRRPLSRP